MKRLFYFVVFLIFLQSIPAAGQTVSVPDYNLLTFLKNNYPSTIDGSNQLIISQAAAVTGILDCSNLDLINIEGLQYFTGVTTLDLDDNQLPNIDQISNLSALQILRLENNLLTALPSFANLTNLEILIAYDNQLQNLPDLSNNTQLKQLIVYDNLLTALPDLSNLSLLERVNAGNNKLNIVPDVSSNPLLTHLILDRNFLIEGPDLSANTNLIQVELDNNYLSFEDLLPYTSHEDFSAFIITAQKKLPVVNIQVLESENLILSTGVDTAVSNITYTWYFNSSLLGTVSNDSLIISPVNFGHEGSYYCVLTHSSFPGLEIKTDTQNVEVNICPTVSDLTFEYEKINCVETGTLKVNLTSLPSQTYTFYLRTPFTEDTLISNTGFFEKLNQPKYYLTIETGACQLILPDPLYIPYEECKEAFITPDGDGNKDSYYFADTGTATIYDKYGKVVITLTIPGEWNGVSRTGSLVPPGYYAIDINNGEKLINLSILY